MLPMTNKTTRRSFMMTVAATGSALAAARAGAQTPAPVLAETDPQAVALGYKADTTKVDKTKFPQHTPAQVCSGCNFYQGKATDAMAPCTLFAGKQVAAKGWCSAWAKKAA
jgi:High potential iron-sulfur protein